MLVPFSLSMVSLFFCCNRTDLDGCVWVSEGPIAGVRGSNCGGECLPRHEARGRYVALVRVGIQLCSGVTFAGVVSRDRTQWTDWGILLESF